MTLKEQIENYKPVNEQEAKDREQMLRFMRDYRDVLTRENTIGHFSSSAFVVNPKRDRMLVVYHRIYDGWIYPGGHADGEEDLLSVALREVKEETNLDAAVLDPNFYSIQSLAVTGHVKRGSYVSAHTHFDVAYLMEADDSLQTVFREDESKGVKWIPFEQASNNTMCDFIRPIHAKLIRKLTQK